VHEYSVSWGLDFRWEYDFSDRTILLILTKWSCNFFKDKSLYKFSKEKTRRGGACLWLLSLSPDFEINFFLSQYT
jgi:hypothetical protein